MDVHTVSDHSTGFVPPAIGEPTLFEDRFDAASRLAARLRATAAADAILVAVSHGGAVVAAEVARELRTPLDMVVVRKIRHPGAPERVLGAVAPGYSVYLRTDFGLTPRQVVLATTNARKELEHVDGRVHGTRHPLDVAGHEVVLIDDGITTGARMVTAARWARTQHARHVVAAVPIAAREAAELVRSEVDLFISLHELSSLGAVGIWYDEFEPVADAEVVGLLADADRELVSAASAEEPQRHRLHLGYRRHT
ncbi:MAG TPA: phosphoribosyltransferase family protein [Gaiellaceae bacterium]|nr:phosphoribosyltransferase family protein [Gaiellaceae bacterium]